MQARTPPNDRPALSSEIVRPLFQRDGGTSASSTYKAFSTGGKPPGRPSATRSVLPCSTPPAFMSPSQPYSASVSDKYQSEGSSLSSRYSAKEDNTNQEDPLAMVANGASQQADHYQPQPKRKRIRLKTARRREQCRANQARYRQKQLSHAKTLDQTVQKLRADISVLEMQRNRLLYGGEKDIWGVVVEYFHFFRFGVPATLSLSSADELHMKMDSAANAETKQQRAFLRSSMTNDVILGERCGVNALMDQWRGYSSSFESVYLQLKRINRTSDQFVSVSATLSVTVSDATIRRVFPHLLDEEQDGEDDDAFINHPSTAVQYSTAASRDGVVGIQDSVN